MSNKDKAAPPIPAGYFRWDRRLARIARPSSRPEHWIDGEWHYVAGSSLPSFYHEAMAISGDQLKAFAKHVDAGELPNLEDKIGSR